MCVAAGVARLLGKSLVFGCGWVLYVICIRDQVKCSTCLKRVLRSV